MSRRRGPSITPQTTTSEIVALTAVRVALGGLIVAVLVSVADDVPVGLLVGVASALVVGVLLVAVRVRYRDRLRDA